MKKSLALFLAGLFALSAGLYVSVFWTIRHRIRQEVKTRIKQGVPEKDLKVFHLSRDAFEKLSFIKKNEFKLKGSFYDIVRQTEKNNEITLYCINDEQEKTLFETLQQIIDGQHQNATKDARKQLSHFLLLKCLPIAQTNFGQVHSFNSKMSLRSKSQNLLAGFLQTPSPPPKSF